jgi:hypothetical protein
MTLARIQALRDLDYAQLAKLAAQRDLVPTGFLTTREWSADRLRLKLIDSICDEELAKLQTPEEYKESLRREDRVDFETGQGRR